MTTPTTDKHREEVCGRDGWFDAVPANIAAGLEQEAIQWREATQSALQDRRDEILKNEELERALKSIAVNLALAEKQGVDLGSYGRLAKQVAENALNNSEKKQ